MGGAAGMALHSPPLEALTVWGMDSGPQVVICVKDVTWGTWGSDHLSVDEWVLALQEQQ